MKKYKQSLPFAAVAAAFLLTICACGGGAKVPNAKTASYDEVIAYLKDGGVIADDSSPADINNAEGYVTDNTGGEFSAAEIADKAFDYDGLYLFWWDLDNPGDLKENYDSIANNGGVIVISGGAAILETSGQNGPFAIAFSQDYAQKDKALELFSAMPSQ